MVCLCWWWQGLSVPHWEWVASLSVSDLKRSNSVLLHRTNIKQWFQSTNTDWLTDWLTGLRPLQSFSPVIWLPSQVLVTWSDWPSWVRGWALQRLRRPRRGQSCQISPASVSWQSWDKGEVYVSPGFTFYCKIQIKTMRVGESWDFSQSYS